MCVEIRTWQPDTWENTCSSVPHMHWRSYCGVFGLLWPWSWGATHPQMLSGPPRTPHYKKNNVCCLSITPTKHSLLLIPPQEVAHLADGESGGPRVLVQEGVELVRLVLQGLGVGDLHGHPGDDAEAITESLVDNLCVNLERKILIGKKILFQKMTLLVVTNSSATGLYSALLLMST